MSSKSNGSSSKRSQGFSLIELMVAITILGVLLAIALPGFQGFVTQNRLTAQINELVGDLSLARNEAGNRGRNVIVCIAASATACATSGADWAVGRLVWVDTNGNGTLDSGNNEVIKYVAPLEGGVSLSTETSVSSISFRPSGGLATQVVFWLCAPETTKNRKIRLPPTGRATATKEPCP